MNKESDSAKVKAALEIIKGEEDSDFKKVRDTLNTALESLFELEARLDYEQSTSIPTPAESDTALIRAAYREKKHRKAASALEKILGINHSIVKQARNGLRLILGSADVQENATTGNLLEEVVQDILTPYGLSEKISLQ